MPATVTPRSRSVSPAPFPAPANPKSPPSAATARWCSTKGKRNNKDSSKSPGWQPSWQPSCRPARHSLLPVIRTRRSLLPFSRVGAILSFRSSVWHSERNEEAVFIGSSAAFYPIRWQRKASFIHLVPFAAKNGRFQLKSGSERHQAAPSSLSLPPPLRKRRRCPELMDIGDIIAVICVRCPRFGDIRRTDRSIIP